MNANETALRTSLAGLRACESCRLRKIRCDRGSPCSQCRMAKLSCHTETMRRRPEKQPNNTTKESSDGIERRLDTIEQLLRQALQQPGLKQDSSPQSTSQSTIDTAPATVPTDEQAMLRQTIGAKAESKAATHMFEHVISQDTAVRRTPELAAALDTLHRIVDNHDFENHQTDTNLEFTVPPPTWKDVEVLLQRAESVKPMSFYLFPPTTFLDLCRKCRAYYALRQPASIVDKVLIFAGLANVCAEFSQVDEVHTPYYNYTLAQGFFALLLQAVGSLPLIMTATAEHIEALLVAAVAMIGFSKPSVSRALIGKAVQLCLDLGYHRLGSRRPEMVPDYNGRVITFWSIYVMDRTISFRLGLAPSIQNDDVDTPRVVPSDDCPPPLANLLNFWVDCGHVQGTICTGLYGPASRNLAEGERARLAEECARQLDKIRARRKQATAGFEDSTSFLSIPTVIWKHSDDVLHFGILATALYAIPQQSDRALAAARECLRLSGLINAEYRNNVYTYTFFCHWTLLHAPLTAFTGIFYAVIARPLDSQNDLALLTAFVDGFDAASRVSEPMDKFYQLCHAFVRVARAYVAAKEDGDSVMLDQTAPQDAASSTVPLVPPMTSTAVLDDGQLTSSPFLDATSSLKDWYAGNAALYSLLEQDFDISSTDWLTEDL